MYLLEGNIGAGKTTLLARIKEQSTLLEIIPEPLNAWHTTHNGTSLLSEFYRDPLRWTYTMEVSTLHTRVKEYLVEQQKNNPLRIMERSIYSGYYCFAQNGYEHEFMTDIEWQSYNDLFSFLTTYYHVPPVGFIYLQTPPEICYERIKKRSRQGEETIPLSYLQQIHEKHELFLLNGNKEILKTIQNIPVLVLNGSINFSTDQQNITSHINDIEQFVGKTIKLSHTSAHIII